MEGGRDIERKREEEKGDKNKAREKEVGEAGPKKDRLESDDKKRKMQIEQEGQAGPSKEKMGKKEKERERLKKIWKKEMDRRKALKKEGEKEVKVKNEEHIAKKGHKRAKLLKEMAKKGQREVEARPKMKRKTNGDEEEPEKKTKNTVEQKELGPMKNTAEEKEINLKDLKKHLIKIKKQKEERRKQLKEAEYQKEMAKKQKEAAELLLKDLTKKLPKEAEFLKVKGREDEEVLRKTSKNTVEQKGLGLKTHLMRIKKEKEAMRKELKEEELQQEMKKKQATGVELLKETTQKWQKQAKLLKQMIQEKDEVERQKVLKKAQNEAGLKKEVVTKAHKGAGLREMIHQEKVTEVELRKTSKNSEEQKGLGLKTHLTRIKTEYEAMRKELKKEELQKEMDKKQATGVELLKETTQNWQKQAELLKHKNREKTEVNTKTEKGAELKEALKKPEKEEGLEKEVIAKAEKKAGLIKKVVAKPYKEMLTEMTHEKKEPGHKRMMINKTNEEKEVIKKARKEPRIQKMIKGEKDWETYELARRLNSYVDQIRSQYYQDMESSEMAIRQRATALYFIDKLALSVGSEKEVSCSSLHVKNVILHRDHDGNEYMVEFNFLSKDLTRSYNKVPVRKRVYNNLENFIENKEAGDKLFNLLTTSTLNEYISSLMPGLTGKVFQTYNASIALQKSLRELSCMSDGQAEKLLAYNRANRAAAVHCNHRQADTKNFEQSMAGLHAKIASMTQELVKAKTELTVAIWSAKGCLDSKWHVKVKKKRKVTRQLEDQLLKLNIEAIGREDGRQISLSTFKINSLDPRITIAWCMNMNVPLEKIYNKSQRVMFVWAIHMTKADFEF